MSRRPLAACLTAAALALAGCGGDSPDAPSADAVQIEGVEQIAVPSRKHVLARVSYPQAPPVGGDHFPPQAEGVLGWQACAVYDEPVVNEFAVHSLEHGAVWLTYSEAASPSDVAALRSLARIRPDYVLVSPYPGQPAPFMATAWGLQLRATGAQDPRLGAFAARYAGGDQGGEPGADCAGGASLDQARDALRSLP